MNKTIAQSATGRKVLRPYQLEAKASAMVSWAAGKKQTLVAIATGGGKTLVAVDVMREFPHERIVFLCPSRELVNQAVKTIRSHIGVNPGVEMARQRSRTIDRIVVGTIQTLAGRELPGVAPGLVVVDEAHHSAATVWRKLLARWPDAKRLDLSATPYRLDNKPLAVDGAEFHVGLLELIQQGYLADIKLLQCPVKVDMGKLRVTGGEFNDGEMAARVLPHLERLANWIASEYADRRLITFTPDRNVSQVWTEALCARGLAAAHIDGAGSEKARRPIYDAFADGRITHLSNAKLLLEGYDNPRADALLMLKLTQSRSLLAQAVGRISRLHPDKEYGLILDPLFVASDQARATFGTAMLGDNPRNARITELMEGGATLSDAVATEEIEFQGAREEARRAREEAAGEGFEDEAGETPVAGETDQTVAPARLEELLRETAVQREGDIDTAEMVSLTAYCQVSGVKRVTSMSVKPHTAFTSGKKSLRVTFKLVNAPTETLYCGFDDPGYRGQLARAWWIEFGGKSPAPMSVDEASVRRDELRAPDFVEPIMTKSRDDRTFVEVRRRAPDVVARAATVTAPYLAPAVAARAASISMMTTDEAEAYTQSMLDAWEKETAPASYTPDRKSTHPWE